MDTDAFTLVPCYKANIIHTRVPHWDKILPMAQSLGSHHTHTTYTRLLRGHIIHIPYSHTFPPCPVTELSSYMDHIHTTMTPRPSYWAYIIAIPHIHNFYPTAQLLDLYHTYITYIKHWLPGTLSWAHIIHIPYTHTFPPGPATGLSSHMDRIHTTMTPWSSYWAYITAILHIHTFYPRAQLLDLYHTYITYIKHCRAPFSGLTSYIYHIHTSFPLAQ